MARKYISQLRVTELMHHLYQVGKQCCLITKSATPILYSVALILLLFPPNLSFKAIFSVPVPCKIYLLCQGNTPSNIPLSVAHSSPSTLYIKTVISVDAFYSNDCWRIIPKSFLLSLFPLAVLFLLLLAS